MVYCIIYLMKEKYKCKDRRKNTQKKNANNKNGRMVVMIDWQWLCNFISWYAFDGWSAWVNLAWPAETAIFESKISGI